MTASRWNATGRPAVFAGLLSLAAAGAALAQTDGEAGVIDLTPMLELMPQAERNASPPVVPPDPVPDAPIAPANVPDSRYDRSPTLEPGPATGIVPDDTGRTPPPTGGAEPVVLPVQVRTMPADPQAAEPAVSSQLRFRSTSGTGIARMTGERGWETLTVFVANPGEVEGIDLSIRSSVALLPERSFLRIVLNDTEIARIDPTPFGDFTKVSLPSAGLIAGENRLVVEAHHQHRIFCGAEATFELWSELDLGASGINLRPGLTPRVSEAHLREGLTAAALDEGQVTLLATEPLPAALETDLQRRLSGLVGGLPVALVTQSPFDPVGATTSIARLTFLPDAGSTHALRQGADGAVVLTFGPDVPPDAFDRYLPAPFALADHPAVIPARTTPLSDLGRADIEMFDRYERIDIPFVLPDDWILSSAQSAGLDLLYRYADNLPRNSLLLVKVNDATIRLLPLSGQPGQILPLLPVRFSARLMEPGVNTLSFETIVPGDPPDRACPPVDGPLVEIFADTALTVPRSPPMAYPSIATILRRLGPDGVTFVETDIHLIDAFARELVPLAQASDGAESSLAVLALNTLDLGRAEAIGLTLSQIEQVLSAARATTGPAPAERPAQSGAVLDKAKTILTRIGNMAWPGDPPIDRWIEGRTARAILVIPDPDAHLSAWLIGAPDLDPDWLARQLSQARLDPEGPKAQVALLGEDGTWESWRPKTQPPLVLGSVGPRDLRTVVGNYASWSPALFVTLLALLLSISVMAALLFVNRTRSRRKE